MVGMLQPFSTIFMIPPASSTTKTGRYDIAEILLKVALKLHKSNLKKSMSTALFFEVLRFLNFNTFT